GRARFVLQCPPSASGASGGEAPEGVEELERLAAAARDRVTLVREKLSERDYADLFHSLDAVLLPYQSPLYREATSGIFAEALARAVVVPAGTWMSRELGRSGGGVEFQRDSAEDLGSKVLHLLNHYGEYRAKAESFRERWKQFHSADTLVDILLREAALTPV